MNENESLSSSPCVGASVFRLESMAGEPKGETKFRFRCMSEGCRTVIETVLEYRIGHGPRLGGLFHLRIVGDILEVKEEPGYKY